MVRFELETPGIYSGIQGIISKVTSRKNQMLSDRTQTSEKFVPLDGNLWNKKSTIVINIYQELRVGGGGHFEVLRVSSTSATCIYFNTNKEKVVFYSFDKSFHALFIGYRHILKK